MSFPAMGGATGGGGGGYGGSDSGPTSVSTDLTVTTTGHAFGPLPEFPSGDRSRFRLTGEPLDVNVWVIGATLAVLAGLLMSRLVR